MEKTVLPLWFIASIFLLRTRGGFADIIHGITPEFLADISKNITPEFLWFFIPAITAQFISYSLKLLRMAVGPDTWKKIEDYVKKVMLVCHCFKLLAFHQMVVLVFSDYPVWVKFIARWYTIVVTAFMSAIALIMHFFYGKQEQVKESHVGPVINLQ